MLDNFLLTSHFLACYKAVLFAFCQSRLEVLRFLITLLHTNPVLVSSSCSFLRCDFSFAFYRLLCLPLTPPHTLYPLPLTPGKHLPSQNICSLPGGWRFSPCWEEPDDKFFFLGSPITVIGFYRNLLIINLLIINLSLINF